MLALLFKIFGSSLPLARIMLALAGAILSSITYLLARRVCSQAIALTLAALATLTTLPYRFLVLHNWDSTLWACLALYCAVRLLEMPSRKWAFTLGLFTSLTVLFEQSKGAGLCLGLGVGFLAIWFLQGRRFLLGRAEFLALVIGFAGSIAITLASLRRHVFLHHAGGLALASTALLARPIGCPTAIRTGLTMPVISCLARTRCRSG